MRDLERQGHEKFGGTISYTVLVFGSGRRYEGHGFGRQGTHTKDRNGKSVGICCAGNYMSRKPSAALLMGIAQTLVDLERAGLLAGHHLSGGHKDVRATDCPGDRLYARIAEINELADAIAAGTAATPRPTAAETLDLTDLAGDDMTQQIRAKGGNGEISVTNGVLRRRVGGAELRSLVAAGLVDEHLVEVSQATYDAIPVYPPVIDAKALAKALARERSLIPT